MTNFVNWISPRLLLRLLAGTTFCYWLVLTYLMHMRIPRQVLEVEAHLPKDKTVHFVLYAGLATALFVTFEQRARVRPMSAPRTRLGRATVLLVFCTLHGYIEEITQPLSGRTYDLTDFVADCVGATSALAVCLIVGGLISSRSKSRSDDAD